MKNVKRISKKWRVFVCIGCFVFLRAVSAYAGTATFGTMDNIRHDNLKMAGIESYCYGFMGGKIEYLLRHPVIFGGHGSADGHIYELAWLWKIAYPVTAWSWSGAVIDSITENGDGTTTIYVTKPHISAFENSSSAEPRSVREWRAWCSTEPCHQNICPKQAQRVVRIDNMGMMPVSVSGYKKMTQNVTSDIVSGLKWCVSHMADVRKSQLLRQYLEGIWHENKVSATVRLPREIELLLYQIIKNL
jgi:hypothetical protein